MKGSSASFGRPPTCRCGCSITPHVSRRRGVSLIELLIVMAIAGVIITLTMTTIHLLLRSERDQSRAVWMTVTVSRLAQVFREDVHATTLAAIAPEHEQLSRLALVAADGREIVYLASEHVLERVETQKGEESHRDQFHFPLGTRMRFERDESPQLVRVVLDVAAAAPEKMPDRRPEQPALAPPRTLTIEALADRDRRFSGSAP
ncbi:MAG: prepilin-type N-terminal cleavage/methylation domain-containing protein [Planctomycetaceae bacterium]|nr:prepilin-type N-terminal cleavage/methylation domain-containing protein [Planctomycetaceae bacterium]